MRKTRILQPIKTAAIETGEEAKYFEFLKEAQKELQEIRRANRQFNFRIKRSSAVIKKNMEEIQKNIDYVKATRWVGNEPHFSCQGNE